MKWWRIWQKTTLKEPNHSVDIGISVIIPYRNEVDNLPSLVDSLSRIHYPNWEVILVNDHSTDGGVEKLKSLIRQYPLNANLIDSPREGKKEALRCGVAHSNYDIIVTTDADCMFHSEWLNVMAGQMIHLKADMLIGPVGLQTEDNLLHRFQLIDMVALQLSGGAAAMADNAIMCNGANLMIKKSLHEQANLIDEVASGDDMFLLEWMKEKKYIVAFVSSPKAIVSTYPASDLHDFLQQRSRWAAKAKRYKDRCIIVTGAIVSSASALILLNAVLGVFSLKMLVLSGILVLIKSIVDFLLLISGRDFFTYKIKFGELLLWQLIYPLYVLTVLFYPLMFNVNWKERKV